MLCFCPNINIISVTKFVDGYGDLYQLWRDTGPFSELVARMYCAELACALGKFLISLESVSQN